MWGGARSHQRRSGGGVLLVLILIGIALGMLIPPLPEPVAVLNPYLTFIFIVVAIVVFVKG